MNLLNHYSLFQLTYIGEGLSAGIDILQSPVNSSSTLLQQAGVAFTLSDQGQQVFVITDPAQLEALQVVLMCLNQHSKRTNLYLTYKLTIAFVSAVMNFVSIFLFSFNNGTISEKLKQIDYTLYFHQLTSCLNTQFLPSIFFDPICESLTSRSYGITTCM